MKFIVEVRPPLPEDLAGVAEKLAEAFNISMAKANGLLRRAPGPVTKPVSEREASVVAGIFESAGLRVATLPESDVLRSTGATQIRGDSGEATPADAAGAEGPRTKPTGTAGSEDTTAAVSGDVAGLERERADADLGDDAHGFEVLPDEDSGVVVDLGRAEDAHTEVHDGVQDGVYHGVQDGVYDELGRGSGADAPSRHGSSDEQRTHQGGSMADRQDAGFARFGETAATAPVAEPLRDDGLEDEVLEDGALDDGVLKDGVLQDGVLEDHVLGHDVLDRDGRRHARPSEDDHLGVDHLGVDHPGVDHPGVDHLGVDHLGVDLAGDELDGTEATSGGHVAAMDGALSSGSGLGRTPGKSESGRAGQAAFGGEPSTSTSGTAAAYRSGVRELQRHGGTTAAELGVHARNAPQRDATPSGVRQRIVAVGIWPALLTLVVVVVGAALTLLPVIRHQQAAAAHRAAASFASSVEGVSADLPLGAPIVNAVLSDIAARSQVRLVGQGVDYLVITDDLGLPLAGWYRNATGLTNLPPDVGRDVAAAAAEVTPRETFGQSLAASWRDVLAMLGLGTVKGQVGSAAIRDGGTLMGAVVVGMDPAPLWSDAGRALLTTLLLGLIPVLLGIFAAMALARRVTGGLRYLVDAADRISRGDLEHAVQLDSKDELGQLAHAIERMRVSLQEGLERLRKRP